MKTRSSRRRGPGLGTRRLRAARWEHVERLHASQELESDVLLLAAEHYANVIEQVAGEDEGRTVCHAIGLGFALRRLEQADGVAAPVPDGVALHAIADPAVEVTNAAARLSSRGGVRLEDEPGVLAELFAPGFEVWRDFSRRCRRTSAGASLQRRRALLEAGSQVAERQAVPALVDYERAFRFGYLVACLEPDAARPPRPATDPDRLLERVDELLARGVRLYGVRDTEVALVVGVMHGTGLEWAPAEDKDEVISAARAGFALRVAEEDAGVAERKLPDLTDSLEIAEARNPALLHWDAAQALAWALVDAGESLPCPAGHPEARARVLAALDGGRPALTERACRFGYALRCAEGSLPHDPDRRLSDG